MYFKIDSGRLALALILFFFTARLLILQVPGTFVDTVDLIFHEAGHVIFAIFGEFMQVLGGTIMQLIIPGTVTFAFYKRHDIFAVCVGIWWFGQNLINIAYYARDAVVQQLKLLGGGRHDWYYLLDKASLLDRTDIIGWAILVLGVVVSTVSLFYLFKFSLTEKYADQDEDPTD